MKKSILDEIPQERLFLMHQKNRKYLEGKRKWSSLESDKFIISAFLWAGNLSFVIFCFWFVFFFDITRELLLKAVLPIAFLFFLAVVFGLKNFFEYLQASELRKNGKLIVGKISGHKMTEKGDSQHIILNYSFRDSKGDLLDGVTDELPWSNAQYFIPRKLKLSFSSPATTSPQIADFVIVQLIESQNKKEYIYDLL